jgi:hypothetical protein
MVEVLVWRRVFQSNHCKRTIRVENVLQQGTEGEGKVTGDWRKLHYEDLRNL